VRGFVVVRGEAVCGGVVSSLQSVADAYLL
jgi:hypothetical protein